MAPSQATLAWLKYLPVILSLLLSLDLLNMEEFFPIRRRGKFLKDDFFKDYQSDFDSAINKVMDRFEGRTLLADQFSNYRKMKNESGDTGTVASISDTKDHYVIVLDLSDFVHGSITVNTVGRNAVVEAVYENQKFSKKYPMPQIVNTDGVKCAMSDEGILTITAPKHVARNVPLGSDDDSQDNPAASTEPLKLEIDDSAIHTAGQTRKESSEYIRRDSASFKPTESRRLSIDRRGKFFQDPKFEGVWSDFEIAMDDMIEKNRRKREMSRLERRGERDAVLQKFSRQFFSDEHTDKSDEDFEGSLKGRFHTYRNLRKWDPEDATQAMKVNSTDRGYKIVMDAKDMEPNSLSVKTSGEGLVVSGGKGSSAFKRRFSLPGLSNPDSVQATISEDGILTISVPFK